MSGIRFIITKQTVKNSLLFYAFVFKRLESHTQTKLRHIQITQVVFYSIVRYSQVEVWSEPPAPKHGPWRYSRGEAHRLWRGALGRAGTPKAEVGFSHQDNKCHRKPDEEIARRQPYMAMGCWTFLLILICSQISRAKNVFLYYLSQIVYLQGALSSIFHDVSLKCAKLTLVIV